MRENRIDALCVGGVPEDAIFLALFDRGNDLVMLMESPSWDLVPYPDGVPEMLPSYTRLYSDLLLDDAYAIIAMSQDSDAIEWLKAYQQHKEQRGAL